jgi:predicted MFS family arabinose efflux permease
MIRNIHRYYFSSFKDLSTEVWWLSLITFINRAGTMIIPFLTLYLTKHLEFTLSQVGWIMMSFGGGSVVGSWLGGKLTDIFGFYKVMYISLFFTGIMFISLQWITTFYGVLIAIFLVMSIADTFRPALFVALKHYSKKENQTRSITLIRLAINLGFSMGPAIGGLIITSWSYSGLFWVDGITCILATIVFMIVINTPEKINADQKDVVIDADKKLEIPVYKDGKFMLFIFITFLMGFVFMQVFSTVPIFYRDVFNLDEGQIGLLLAMNGLMIFFLEMPLVHEAEKRKISKVKIIQYSIFLIAISYFVFNIADNGLWILIVNMLIITLGEMFGFPFTNTIAMTISPKGKEGVYMAYYTISFSLAHLFSAKFGLMWIDNFGYTSTWYVIGGIGLFAWLLSFKLKRLMPY